MVTVCVWGLYCLYWRCPTWSVTIYISAEQTRWWPKRKAAEQSNDFADWHRVTSYHSRRTNKSEVWLVWETRRNLFVEKWPSEHIPWRMRYLSASDFPSTFRSRASVHGQCMSHNCDLRSVISSSDGSAEAIRHTGLIFRKVPAGLDSKPVAIY